MIFSYPTEIRNEKELTFEIDSLTSVKTDGLYVMLIPILRHRCVFSGHVHSKMADSFALLYKSVYQSFLPGIVMFCKSKVTFNNSNEGLFSTVTLCKLGIGCSFFPCGTERRDELMDKLIVGG